jgi:hypothetical protein
MTLTISTGKNDTRRSATWAAVAAADNPTMPRYAPLFSMVCASLQVVGGGTVTLEGSNDGVTYATLKDLAGDDLVVAGPGYVEFSSAAAFVRPRIAGGPVDVILTHWAG